MSHPYTNPFTQPAGGDQAEQIEQTLRDALAARTGSNMPALSFEDQLANAEKRYAKILQAYRNGGGFQSQMLELEDEIFRLKQKLGREANAPYYTTYPPPLPASRPTDPR